MRYIVLDTIDSTNEYIKRNIDQLGHLDCVRANYQSHGKGRNGHTWESSNKRNLLLSLLFKEIVDPIQLSQCMSYAVVKTLQDYGIEARIKFPNDIYVQDEKICGLLVETIYNQSLQGIIVGIGLNVNDQEHCSLQSCISQVLDIEDVKDKLYASIIDVYQLYKNHQYPYLLKQINQLSYLKNKWIDYLDYGEVLFKELTPQGTVIIEDRNHHHYHIFINEISLANKR